MTLFYWSICQGNTGFWLLVILILIKCYLGCCLDQTVAKVDPLIQNFNLSQRSHYSIHIHWEILDLAFDTSNSKTVSFQPSPYSDHFFFFFSSLMIALMQIVAVNNFTLNTWYITCTIHNTCTDILMQGLAKMFSGNNHQTNMIFSFLA